MAAGTPNPRELAMVVASAVAGALSQQQSQQNTPTNPSTPNHSHDLTATTSTGAETPLSKWGG